MMRNQTSTRSTTTARDYVHQHGRAVRLLNDLTEFVNHFECPSRNDARCKEELEDIRTLVTHLDLVYKYHLDNV